MIETDMFHTLHTTSGGVFHTLLNAASRDGWLSFTIVAVAFSLLAIFMAVVAHMPAVAIDPTTVIILGP